MIGTKKSRPGIAATNHDAVGNKLVAAPEEILGPGPHLRVIDSRLTAEASMHEIVTASMVAGLGGHRTNHCKLIGLLGHLREMVGDLKPVCTR